MRGTNSSRENKPIPSGPKGNLLQNNNSTDSWEYCQTFCRSNAYTMSSVICLLSRLRSVAKDFIFVLPLGFQTLTVTPSSRLKRTNAPFIRRVYYTSLGNSKRERFWNFAKSTNKTNATLFVFQFTAWLPIDMIQTLSEHHMLCTLKCCYIVHVLFFCRLFHSSLCKKWCYRFKFYSKMLPLSLTEVYSCRPRLL